MTHDSDSTATTHRPPPGAILIVPLVAALVLTLFAWPNARLEPRDLPLGVAGPAPAAVQIERQVAQRDGAFEIHRYATEGAARRAIEDRNVYGALVATPRGPKLLVSSAASPAVAQMLGHAASEGAAAGQAQGRGDARERGGVPVQDVVAASPRASALASSVLPLVIAGILVGVVASLATASPLGRAGLVAGGSALVGIAAALVVQTWLDVVGGSWLINAGVLGLTVFAIGAALAGLYALFGKGGLLGGILTMILVGNPFSGVASAPEMLPQPAGAVGQLLPPGAGGNLLRSTGFFDGAAAGSHVAVLAAWAFAGLALLAVMAARERRTERVAVAA